MKPSPTASISRPIFLHGLKTPLLYPLPYFVRPTIYTPELTVLRPWIRGFGGRGGVISRWAPSARARRRGAPELVGIRPRRHQLQHHSSVRRPSKPHSRRTATSPQGSRVGRRGTGVRRRRCRQLPSTAHQPSSRPHLRGAADPVVGALPDPEFLTAKDLEPGALSPDSSVSSSSMRLGRQRPARGARRMRRPTPPPRWGRSPLATHRGEQHEQLFRIYAKQRQESKNSSPAS
jgi:hypothetical protein